tara:strand:- start:766 stop:993 length:228 start_codon:yes stop_codon:yes gene_type:complete
MGLHAKDLGKMLVGNHPLAVFIGSLVIYVIFLLLILLFGEYLWNHVLVKSLTIVKPINSVWQLVGIMILVRMIMC